MIRPAPDPKPGHCIWCNDPLPASKIANKAKFCTASHRVRYAQWRAKGMQSEFEALNWEEDDEEQRENEDHIKRGGQDPD